MSEEISISTGLFSCFSKPRHRKRLFIYYVILIVVFGNVGTLFSLAQHLFDSHQTVRLLDVLRNFATYTIAIAVTSFADYMLKVANGRYDARSTLLVLFGLAGTAALAGLFVLWSDALASVQKAMFISAILASWLWFIAKGDDPALVTTDAFDALGGKDPMNP